MCDHPLDAVELAGFEEGKRGLVGAGVPGKGCIRIQRSNSEGNPRSDDRHGRKMEDREERKMARERMEVIYTPEDPQ